MAEKEIIHCYHAASKGLQTITEDYCLKCNDPQRGVKSLCPDSVRKTITKEKVFGAFEKSSEAARLAVETYSDLLKMGGSEAAEAEKPDLLQDVPDEEKETVDGGMLVLLSLHRAEHGTEPPRP